MILEHNECYKGAMHKVLLQLAEGHLTHYIGEVEIPMPQTKYVLK